MLQRYTSMLSAIKDLCPTAHIGGGAVRDTLLERPIRDVDLFLDESPPTTRQSCCGRSSASSKSANGRRYEMFSDPAVERVAKFEKADETIPVCLIGLHHEYYAKRATMQEQPRPLRLRSLHGRVGRRARSTPRRNTSPTSSRRPSRCAVPMTRRSSTTRCRASTR